MTRFSSVVLLIALFSVSANADPIPSQNTASSADSDIGRIEEDDSDEFPWSAEATASFGVLFLPSELAYLTGSAIQSGLAVTAPVGIFSDATCLTFGVDARVASAKNARFFDVGILVGAQHPVLSSLSIAVAAGPSLQYRRLKFKAGSQDFPDVTRSGTIGGYSAMVSIQTSLPTTSVTWVLSPALGFSGGAPLEVDLAPVGNSKVDLNGSRWDAHLGLGIRL